MTWGPEGSEINREVIRAEKQAQLKCPTMEKKGQMLKTKPSRNYGKWMGK